MSTTDERSLISTLLRGADIAPVLELVVVDDLVDPFHRRLFAYIKGKFDDGDPFNQRAVPDEMQLPDHERILLTDLEDHLHGRTDDAPKYARKVREASLSLQLRKLCGQVADSRNFVNGQLGEIAATIKRLEETGRTPAQNADLFDTWEEFENAPPLTFSINGFLQDEATTAIAGLSGDGKTWIALSLSRALLFGPGKLWNLFEVPGRAEKVIYLIPESSRTAIKHRLKLMGLYEEIYSGRLLIRTLSKGPTVPLSDASLLREMNRADVICDTAIRFIKSGADDAKAGEVAEGLSNDFFSMLRAGARTVIPLFHSPKNVRADNTMTLESMVRGSGEFGAVLATCWGIKQIDRIANVIHIENLKPRDFEPCGPFQIIGRPFIDDTGDFALHKRPEDCGPLAEEQPINRGGGAPQAQRDSKTANHVLVRQWLAENRDLTSKEISQKFRAEKIGVSDSTVRKYRKELGL